MSIIATSNHERRVPISTVIMCFYIVLLPIATSLSGIVGSISLLNYFAVLYVVTAFVERLNSNKILFKVSQWAIYSFMAYSLVTCTWNKYMNYNYYFYTFLLSFIVLLFSTIKNYNSKELAFIIKAILISSLTIIGATLANINHTYAGRIIITVTSEMDPNDFGCGSCILFATLLMAYNYSKKILPVIILISILLCVLLTGSRGALLMCVVEVIAWVILFLNRGKWKTLLLVLLAAIALYLASTSLSNELLDRFSVDSLLNTGGSGRLKIWKAGLDKFIHSDFLHMIFGYGHGAFAKTVGYYGGGRSYPYEAHNIFVNALIEGGIVGTSLLIAAFYQSLKLCRMNNNHIGFISLVGLIVVGLTLDVQSYRLFPMVFFVAIILGNNNTLFERLIKEL